jgi:hypothetical protein
VGNRFYDEQIPGSEIAYEFNWKPNNGWIVQPSKRSIYANFNMMTYYSAADAFWDSTWSKWTKKEDLPGSISMILKNPLSKTFDADKKELHFLKSNNVNLTDENFYQIIYTKENLIKNNLKISVQAMAATIPTPVGYGVYEGKPFVSVPRGEYTNKIETFPLNCEYLGIQENEMKNQK